ncbi:MAG: class I SAM-dependent rRNA methyltransferase [Chitinispirillaceae bacterium]|nr:class I SAM-dependent rRNA methyltransferase [Chitinispirillaceae bacterium]
MITIHLKRNREKSVRGGNPWIFSGSIDRVSGTPSAGEHCIVRTFQGEPLGCGYYNHHSAITVRMLRWGEEAFNDAALSTAIQQAIAQRQSILGDDTDSCRLINSEGDFLPGLVVDSYTGGLVMQIQTAGMERMREAVVAALVSVCTPPFIYERSDPESRAREGIAGAEGICYGSLPPGLVIRENRLVFGADIARGQKTGFFFDQRHNRALLRSYAAGRCVCDCFSYSGGFAVSALAGGARSVDAVDQSEAALRQLRDNVAANNLDGGRVTTYTADVFSFLRETGARYDCIVLDPPKFARHPGEVERASRGYKDINLLACKNSAPGGIIFTFSCSNAVDARLFRQIVFAAAADSGRRFQLLHSLAAGPDHPVNLAHREGEYLKGLVLRAEG